METALLLSSRGSGGLGRVQLGLGLGLGPAPPRKHANKIQTLGWPSVCLSVSGNTQLFSWLAGSHFSADLPPHLVLLL